MKKGVLLALLAMVLIAFIPACKTTTGDKIAAATGIGDGKVSIIESMMINTAVTAALVPLSTGTKTALHVVSGAMLEKLSTDDAIMLTTLDERVPEIMAANGITDTMVLDEVTDFAGRVKAAITEAVEGQNGGDKAYLVGVKAVLTAIHNKTEAM